MGALVMLLGVGFVTLLTEPTHLERRDGRIAHACRAAAPFARW